MLSVNGIVLGAWKQLRGGGGRGVFALYMFIFCVSFEVKTFHSC